MHTLLELYIGMISGTSMDAVDALIVNLTHHPPRLIHQHSHKIPETIKQRISTPDALKVSEVGELDVELGNLFASAALQLLNSAGIKAEDIAAIGSHGQTLFHAPVGPNPFTLQLGDPNIIAERTGITTVADFRRRDMAAGGQGAPLVPAFHREVFHSGTEQRAVLNIGGIANLTLLPANEDEAVTGFDTGPGNALMDSWIDRHQQQRCDLDGGWAACGQANTLLLEKLMDDAYLAKAPPKSTGREYFNLTWLDNILNSLKLDICPVDVQATLAEYTASSIADSLTTWTPSTRRLLVCGGGVHNAHLMGLLAQKLHGCIVESTAKHSIDPDWVEAAAFAWLAKQTLAGRPGSIATVTGASHSRVLGGIYHG